MKQNRALQFSAAALCLSGMLVATPAFSACHECGVVIKSYNTHTGPSTTESAAGTIGGGVVGGLLGHQVGGGRGKTLATVAGAAGGAYLGNRATDRYAGSTRHAVKVKFEDGRVRTFTSEQPWPFETGSHVRLEGERLVAR